MTSFGYRVDDENGVHVRLTVWAGPDDEHRGNCGQVMIRVAEADAFRAMITEHERPKKLTLASILADAGYPGTAEDLSNGMCTLDEALTAAREAAKIVGHASGIVEIIEVWQKGVITGTHGPGF